MDDGAGKGLQSGQGTTANKQKPTIVRISVSGKYLQKNLYLQREL